MPTPTKGARLGGSPSHERLLLANLATALFEHDRITTTEAKAKRLRPLAERLITFAKRGDLHARRQVMTVIRDKDVVHKLFAEIGPTMASRPGGYTRIVKVGPRKGDNAPMAVIELVGGLSETEAVVREAERARGATIAASKAPTGRTREIAQDAAGESATAAGVAAVATGAQDAVDVQPSDADEVVTAAENAVAEGSADAEAVSDAASGEDPDAAAGGKADSDK